MLHLGVHTSPGVPSVDGASIIFVCEGNVDRSPAAELILRDLLPLPSLHVSSAGTGARVGEPVTGVMTRLLAERGIDATGSYARQLTPEMIGQADLVVTMTSLQRRHVVLIDPSALRRSWTLLSLAESLRTVPAAGPDEPRSLRSLGERAAAHRSAGGGDVPDPYGRSSRVCSRILDQLVPAVAAVAEATHRELLQARLVAADGTPHAAEAPGGASRR